ncbi:hypothetical protein FHR92_001920 [Fontibacillus solani]|uniref:Uncharacterized protein n=1 Tax=Fontibacillus solani TaxID=1572857 RepID=A0A7W3SSW4_9BACL|nr:hypothetical protein [Fontibacillus solani]
MYVTFDAYAPVCCSTHHLYVTFDAHPPGLMQR